MSWSRRCNQATFGSGGGGDGGDNPIRLGERDNIHVWRIHSDDENEIKKARSSLPDVTRRNGNETQT